MRGKCYMLVRSVVHLGVLDEGLVLMVWIVMLVFLQRCKGFLQRRYMEVIGVDLFG